MGWGNSEAEGTGSELGSPACHPSLPSSWAQLLALLGLSPLNQWGCSACLSPGPGEAVLGRQDPGSRGGGGAGVGGYMVYLSRRAGLVLPSRLVLTLTPPCGPRACPRASPPFLVENRKPWLSSCVLLREGRGEHTPLPIPCPGGPPPLRCSYRPGCSLCPYS